MYNKKIASTVLLLALATNICSTEKSKTEFLSLKIVVEDEPVGPEHSKQSPTCQVNARGLSAVSPTKPRAPLSVAEISPLAAQGVVLNSCISLVPTPAEIEQPQPLDHALLLPANQRHRVESQAEARVRSLCRSCCINVCFVVTTTIGIAACVAIPIGLMMLGSHREANPPH